MNRSVQPYYIAYYQHKGKFLRKQCASIKVNEIYTGDKHLIFPSTFDNQNIDSVIVPSPFCLIHYLGIFDKLNDENSPEIILQSLLRVVLENSSQGYRRSLKKYLFESPSCFRYLYFNEFHKTVARHQRTIYHEKNLEWASHLFLNACVYLRKSMELNIRIIIAEENDPLGIFIKKSPEIWNSFSIIHLEDYIKNVKDSISRNNLLLEFLQIQSQIHQNQQMLPFNQTNLQTLSYNTTSNKILFSPHLSLEEINDRVKQGSISIGKFQIFKHNLNQAEVEIYTRGSACSFGTVLVDGKTHMNRAICDDIVAIEMLPEEQWTTSTDEDFLVDTSGTIEDSTDVETLDEESGNEISLENTVSGRPATASQRKRRIPSAVVVGIVRRDLPDIICTVPLKMGRDNIDPKIAGAEETEGIDREEFILVRPADRRYPRIRIRTRQWSALQGKHVLVALSSHPGGPNESWPRTSQYPNGYLVRVLGDSGDWKTEVETVLLRNSINPKPFSMAALACLPKIPTQVTSSADTRLDSKWTVPDEEAKRRKDLRISHQIFSVDPPGCQDIDDAMSMRWTSKGKFELGVHIADVCAFLPKGCPLDEEARTRGTTVYLPHKRLDMLPSLLSSDIASLHGDRDRLAVTTFWNVAVNHSDGSPICEDEDPMVLWEAGDLVFELEEQPCWIGRTVIRSCAAMTYEQAHNLVHRHSVDEEKAKNVPAGTAGRPVEKKLHEPLRRSLKMLTVIGRHLLKRRVAAGALTLQQGKGSELKFKLDLDDIPIKVEGKEELEIHNTIAELMILANESIARVITEDMPTSALLRIHPEPSPEKLKNVQELAQAMRLNVFTSDKKSELWTQLRTYHRNLRGASLSLITSLVIRAMSEAKYVSSGDLIGNLGSSGVVEDTELGNEWRRRGHYGLGLAHYTHFTSPIRRYADVIVHRQLIWVLEGKKRSDGISCADPIHGAKQITEDVHKLSLTDTDRVASLVNSSMSSQSSSQSLHMGRVADGRKTYEKVSSQSVTITEPVTKPSDPPMLISDLVTNDTAGTGGTDEDLDFLDEMLSGVGEDLLSVSLPPFTPLLTAVTGTVTSESATRSIDTETRVHNRDKEEEENDDVDLLDMILGDVGEDLSSTTSRVNSQTGPLKEALSTQTTTAIPLKNLQQTLSSTTKIDQTFEISSKLKIDDNGIYTPLQISQITDHLNVMNRRAKQAQYECQRLFLYLYLKDRNETYDAVVYSLKNNGFLAYISDLDMKGPVYLLDTQGVVNVRPSLLADQHLQKKNGSKVLKASQGDQEECQRFPDYNCTLIYSFSDSNAKKFDEDLSIETADVPDELLLHHRDDDPSVLQKGSNSNNNNINHHPYLALKPLQRVKVRVRTSGYSLSSDIRFEFVGVEANDKRKELSMESQHTNKITVESDTSSSGYQSFDVWKDNIRERDENRSNNKENKEVMSNTNENSSVLIGFGIPPSRRTSIVYEMNKQSQASDDIHAFHVILQYDSKQVNIYHKGGTLNTDSVSTTGKKQKKKSEPSSKYEKFQLKGTGRIAFGIGGVSVEDDGVRDIFYFSCNTSQPDGSKGNQQSTADKTVMTISGFRVGHDAAVYRMKALGEEWAQEEDLPSSAGYSENYEGANTETGLAAERGEYNQIANSTLRRQQLLKKEKRKMKMYG